ncbi:beta family protein [Streptomyces sp. ST2-7A]|uniref:beta family protein n=1 Tax=Streptomyces sp. ST2-7A TaxID=2907214 RepID=UPI001F18624C|nr:beta family protein [Streptomyces sp. ST2-7A]MCE7080382.1 beta family protein [Streptomyces sp. ST2-7A]
MSETPYVPVLPVRKFAVQAHRMLHPPIRHAMFPLWTLHPCPGVSPKDAEEHLRPLLADVGKCQAGRPGWIDASALEDGQWSRLLPALVELVEFCSLRPVVTVGRHPHDPKQGIPGVIGGDSGELGIRVRVPGEWRESSAEVVRTLVGRLDPATRVDLLLDLSVVSGDRPEAAKEALRALDALVPLASWRTVVVLAGGFPEPAPVSAGYEWVEEARTERLVWREVLAAGRAYSPLLAPGDYAVRSPSVLEAPVRDQGEKRHTGTLRYTTEDSFVICRMWHRGRRRDEMNRETLRRLVGLPEFRGTAAGAGETWLWNAARGHDDFGGPVGTGAHADWIRIGTVQHLTRAVRERHG